jgi:hypothetical protein
VLSLVTFFARSKESDSLAQRVKALALEDREDEKQGAGFQLSLE